jgi:hypothetical protein
LRSLDLYFAASKLGATAALAGVAAVGTFLVLTALWYALPVFYRRRDQVA